MNKLYLLIASVVVSTLMSVCFTLDAQTVKNANFQTLAHFKSDGTIQDSSYRTIGHIKDDDTVQDASYRTIGYAKGIPLQLAAFHFFFTD